MDRNELKKEIIELLRNDYEFRADMQNLLDINDIQTELDLLKTKTKN